MCSLAGKPTWHGQVVYFRLHGSPRRYYSSYPGEFLDAMASQLADLAVIEDDPEGKHFHMFSWHFSAYDRRKHDVGCCNYVPLNLGEVPDYYRRFLDPVDIAILKTCPMDDGGYFNFGPTSLWQQAVIERAKLAIVEINREMPYVFGRDNGVHMKDVDFIIEGDHQPCAELPNPEPSEIDRTVARYIAAEVEDGSCLQIGIGGM